MKKLPLLFLIFIISFSSKAIAKKGEAKEIDLPKDPSLSWKAMDSDVIGKWM